jgi:hypothetical protein
MVRQEQMVPAQRLGLAKRCTAPSVQPTLPVWNIAWAGFRRVTWQT